MHVIALFITVSWKMGMGWDWHDTRTDGFLLSSIDSLYNSALLYARLKDRITVGWNVPMYSGWHVIGEMSLKVHPLSLLLKPSTSTWILFPHIFSSAHHLFSPTHSKHTCYQSPSKLSKKIKIPTPPSTPLTLTPSLLKLNVFPLVPESSHPTNSFPNIHPTFFLPSVFYFRKSEVWLVFHCRSFFLIQSYV